MDVAGGPASCGLMDVAGGPASCGLMDVAGGSSSCGLMDVAGGPASCGLLDVAGGPASCGLMDVASAPASCGLMDVAGGPASCCLMDVAGGNLVDAVNECIYYICICLKQNQIETTSIYSCIHKYPHVFLWLRPEAPQFREQTKFWLCPQILDCNNIGLPYCENHIYVPIITPFAYFCI